jgi:hypothetical protein
MPPHLATSPEQLDRCAFSDPGYGVWPTTHRTESCGEHPRFKDYLAALEAGREAPEPSRP